MLLNNSDAPSIDWDAPWANDGGKAKKASPTKKILSFGLYNSLLTNTGKHFKLIRLSKIDWEILFCNCSLIFLIKFFSIKSSWLLSSFAVNL